MFRQLPAIAAKVAKPALENLESADPPAAAPSESSAPPTRFGATRIVLKPDPDEPEISITEVPHGGSVSDYVVFINRTIRGEGSYYAELITLLDTIAPESRVTMYIGSPGGSLATGAMIANAIKTCKAPVTTVVLGIAASAAALIWSYGHNRKVADGAAVMFHMSSHMDWGNSEAIRVQAENTIRYVKEVAIDPFVEQGLITAEEAAHIIDKRLDLWLDSDTLNARLEAIDGKSA